MARFGDVETQSVRRGCNHHPAHQDSRLDARGDGRGLFLVALALLASVYFEGPEYIHTLPFFSGVAFTPDGAIALAACDRYTVPAKLRPRDRAELPAWWHRGVRAFRLSDGQELDLVPLYTPIREIFVSRDGTRMGP